MIRALVINKSFSDNLGDQAIGRAMENLFNLINCEVITADLTTVQKKQLFIKDISLNNKNRKKFKLLKTVKWYLKHKNSIGIYLDKTLKECDAVFVGGGELIQDNNIFPIALFLWMKEIRKRSPQLPIYYFGVGATAGYSFFAKKLLLYALNQASGIYVRDGNSKENLEKVFNIKSIEIPDVVFSLDLSVNTQQKIAKTVALGITSPFRIKQYNCNSQDYFREMMAVVGHYDGSTITLCYTDSNDYAACKAFATYLVGQKKDCSNIRIGEYRDLEGFLSFLSTQEVVVSPRMHACILGIASLASATPIIISPKMDAFLKKYCQTDFSKSDCRNNIIASFNSIIGVLNEKNE